MLMWWVKPIHRFSGQQWRSDATSNGAIDAFAVKINGDGSDVYATYLGGRRQ